MRGGHQLQGLSFDDAAISVGALASQRGHVEQHILEIRNGRDRRSYNNLAVTDVAQCSAYILVAARKAGSDSPAHLKVCVHHSERREDMLEHVLAKRPSAHIFYYLTQCREAVIRVSPFAARRNLSAQCRRIVLSKSKRSAQRSCKSQPSPKQIRPSA